MHGYIALAKLKENSPPSQRDEDSAASPMELALRGASDIVMTLNEDLIVEEVHAGALSDSFNGLEHWCGEKIDTLLTDESRPKLKHHLGLLSDGVTDRAASVELNHTDGETWEFPVRYTIQPRGPHLGFILVGRDLRSTAEVQQQLVRAQLALEKEYEKHRDFETRYRVLRDTLSEAVVFVDASSGRILDINPLAAKTLGVKLDGLTGVSINSVLALNDGRAALDVFLASASERETDPIAATATHLKELLAVRPTLFRSAGDMMLLCRLESSKRDSPVAEDLVSALSTLYQRGSDAIVFTDSRGAIRHANEGFLTLCDVVLLADLKNKMLGDFLLRGTIDQKVLLETAAQTGRIKTFTTKLKSAHGGEIDVEIAATHLNDRADPYFGFVLRDRSRTESGDDGGNHDEAMQSAMELVGTAPLKELVAATADVVEKMCIETAVKLTDNNRVAAAELLGLSRQSFYVRLRKYGLLKKGED